MAKLKSSRIIYNGSIIRVRKDLVEYPSGLKPREIIEHRGSVGILPVDRDGSLILINQERVAAGKELIEIPAGTLEENEDAKTCAARELHEEVGMEARTLRPILKFYLAPGYSTEKLQLFLATNLKRTEQSLEEDEKIVVKRVTLRRALRMIRSGDIEDAKSICAILSYAYLLRKRS